MKRLHPIYASWVSHVNDTTEKDLIIKALLDCAPACSLQSAINSKLISPENAIKAYRTKYGIKNKIFSIDDFAQDEVNFSRKMDI